MSLKCFSCRTVMFSPGNWAESRHNDRGDTVFDCPHCGAENCARSVDVDGVECLAIYRIKTPHEDIFFGPCENHDCRGHRIVVKPSLPTDTQTSCPDCGHTRMIIKSYI